MKKNNQLSTNILAGKYKNKKLLLPSLETTRSSKSIVKESFFNRLQFDIIDSTFVELFAGSGSIGLEALSRGANKIYFFEKDRFAFNILNQNIDSLDKNSCTTYFGDTFENINIVTKELVKNNQKAYFFIDPPFSYRDGMDEIYNKTLNLVKNLPKEIVELITIEHMSSLKLPNMIGEFELEKQKKFGKTTLSYYI